MLLVLSVCVALLGLGLLAALMIRARGQSAVIALTLLQRSQNQDDEQRPARGSLEPLADRGEKVRWSLGVAAFAVLLLALICRPPLITIFMVSLVGALAGEIFRRGRRARLATRRAKSMEFYLPTVMERIVMGVGTGLDIIPALREASAASHDPLSELLRWIVDVSEGGVPVEVAIEAAARRAECISVKHALIHLGLAHRQGGEIVRPLRELSDATQLAYQELVEEQIARLPVKAVLPLVLTFTGLLICFLTVPLMQVSHLAKKVAHETR